MNAIYRVLSQYPNFDVLKSQEFLYDSTKLPKGFVTILASKEFKLPKGLDVETLFLLNDTIKHIIEFDPDATVAFLSDNKGYTLYKISGHPIGTPYSTICFCVSLYIKAISPNQKAVVYYTSIKNCD